MIPRLLKFFPASLRERIFYRWINPRQQHFPRAFRDAPLAFAPGAHMCRLFPGDVISGSIALNGFYELALSHEISRIAKESGGHMVDVGANLGYFSLLWLAGKPSNRVTAIEASPRNQEAIRANVARNGWSDRLELVCKAAGDQEGTIRFDLGPEEQTGWGGIGTGGNFRRGIEVPLTRLESCIAENDRIDLLKIDVEGAEPLVLSGATSLLTARRVERIYFEENPFRLGLLGFKPGDAIEILGAYGYECRPFANTSDEFVATRP